MVDVSKKLREIREAHNLSILELAKLTGINANNLRKWESGTVVPRLSGIVKLIKFYKISMKDILGV